MTHDASLLQASPTELFADAIVISDLSNRPIPFDKEEPAITRDIAVSCRHPAVDGQRMRETGSSRQAMRHRVTPM